MMRLAQITRYPAFVVAIGGLAIATPCASSDIGDHETYRCNTPNGHFDGSVLPSSNSETHISGLISLHTADISPEWGSLGRVVFHQHGAHYSDGDCGCNGIAVFAYKNPDHIEFHMTANGEDVPIAQSPYDTPITFKIAISPQGAMTVAIGKDDPVIKTVTLRHPEHDTLELTCSGADVSFFDITAL